MVRLSLVSTVSWLGDGWSYLEEVLVIEIVLDRLLVLLEAEPVLRVDL